MQQIADRPEIVVPEGKLLPVRHNQSDMKAFVEAGLAVARVEQSNIGSKLIPGPQPLEA